MNVSLTVELEELVSAKVESGMYHTASEVVREGLRLLKERDQHLEALRKDVRAGFYSVDQGEYTDYSVADLPALAGRIKARGLKRLTL